MTIGTRTVVHPKAQIIAEAGPIIIGDNNLIEERARWDAFEFANFYLIFSLGEMSSRAQCIKRGQTTIFLEVPETFLWSWSSRGSFVQRD